jgi:EAL domain-containing protein (putative c-di-GMP-specific phosphodiesterase class I)
MPKFDFPPAEFEFSFAFQPIVDARTREVISYEALVRGPKGQPAADVLSRVDKNQVYNFDRTCRHKAIELARSLRIRNHLNLNLFPHALYQTEMNIRATLQVAYQCGFPIDDIVFEVTESERIADNKRLVNLIRMYQEFGFETAIDDFGSGYAGLQLLVEYRPNCIKLDRSIIANVHCDTVRQAVVEGMVMVCTRLNIQIMAEGVERVEEYNWLRRAGVNIFQGYYFAHPAFEALPEVDRTLFSV